MADNVGLMRDLLTLTIHLLITCMKLLRPGGIRAVAAESLLLKHQILIGNRSGRRTPNLTTLDRFVLALATAFIKPHRISKPSALVTHLSGCCAQAQDFGQREPSSIIRRMSPATKSETPWIVVHDNSPVGGDDGRNETDCCIDRAHLENVALEDPIEIHAFAFLDHDALAKGEIDNKSEVSFFLPLRGDLRSSKSLSLRSLPNRQLEIDKKNEDSFFLPLRGDLRSSKSLYRHLSNEEFEPGP